MSDQPHSSWAEVYDIAYQRSFGDFYTHLTDAAVDLVASRVRLPASVIDFGVGTGCLSIPLSRKGYDVTAVEPCQEVLLQLNGKDFSDPVKTVYLRMDDFRSERGSGEELVLRPHGVAPRTVWGLNGKWWKEDDGSIRLESDTGKVFTISVEGNLGHVLGLSDGHRTVIKRKKEGPLIMKSSSPARCGEQKRQV